MKILKINWDGTAGALAVWPSPIDADACFERAGFTDFADSDDEWDAEFRAILSAAIELGTSKGQPRVRSFVGIKGIEHPTLLDVLLASATDDQFGTAVVEFGSPPELTIITADGHPLIWLLPARPLRVPLDGVRTVAIGKPVERVTLEWAHLTPEEVRTRTAFGLGRSS